MGKKYVRYSSSSSSDSDSESSAFESSSQHRYRERKQRRHHRRRSPPAPEYPTRVSLGAAATNTKEEEKKKKKPKPPPQEGINKIWERFQQKKFSKALTVLPFSPVPPSTSGERANELLSSGYERAAEECRRKVRKIIAECRRVNTRYRDPGWDLDWDLKWEKGNCLNSLGQRKFDISMSNMLSPSANIPKAVKRVHEIFEKPTFMDKLLPSDIKQGNLGNCWFVASLTGLANVEEGIKRICVEYDTKIGIYGFVFFRDGEWIHAIVDDKLYLKSPCWDSPSMQRDLLQQIDREDVERVYRKTYQTGSKALFFAQCKDQNETWVPLIEKAYAKAHGDYACLSGGWIGEALEDLSGGVTTELLASDIFDTEMFWENELSRVNQEFLFGCSTGLLGGGYGEREGITEGHAYVIMEARTLKNGTRLVKLRNPWGKIKKGNWEGAWSDGSKEWTTEVQEELGHSFGGDSIFWISYRDLLNKYQHFDRTRLFRSPEWRCCQRWIGVEVPWQAQYNEKFHFKLTKDSPVVLVLSQLDARYFKGLGGQYSFRLGFRVHAQGRPGAEDYIVRSHGNYLMDRSVSVDLPDMAAGSYTVFIRVMAERSSNALSVEDVVKRECKRRVENEKLSQVGHAYDLAHSKGAAHLEKLAKLRKKTDQKKASEARQKERRKMWEKRHVQRDIQKKQSKKNAEKRERRKTKENQKTKDEPKQNEVQTTKEEGKKAEVKAARRERDQSESAMSSSNSTPQMTPQETPQDSPSSDRAEPAGADDDKVAVPPVDASAVSGGPPAPPTAAATDADKPDKQTSDAASKPAPSTATDTKPKPAPTPVEESDGNSSDSPVEDWEELYSSDDMSPKPRMAPAPAPAAKKEESDDEEPDTPDPWNAICIVGFRVYSKDENLELRVVMEGGELEENGMGEKGEVDLDNGQVNAGGQRESAAREEERREREKREKEAEDKRKQEESDKKVADGFASYPTIIVRMTSEFERVTGEKKAEDKDALDVPKQGEEGSSDGESLTPVPPEKEQEDDYFSQARSEDSQEPSSPLDQKDKGKDEEAGDKHKRDDSDDDDAGKTA
ncbi:Calpain-D [Pleurostoma richardsiae]|uniref:Calpain-D n=1 Tax=Pleurostoma richardsiae TaxID=41990 RepID=A0AA38VEU6_9PEZI|nr:Calpain-D [Pleurostoma richardsiae]